jgi:dihydrolipoamide dehydrogenase
MQRERAARGDRTGALPRLESAWYDARMSEQTFDAVVIGAGPGGYPAAIRLGQLKIKTAIIEREYMGGVCLNVGCIPSKAVIHAAKTFEKMGKADEIGIGIQGKPTIDMKKLQTWKGGVVTKLTSGVRTLLKGNGVEIFDGTAKIEKGGPNGHKITITGKAGTQTITAKNIVIATGSRPLEIPGFKIDQQRVIDSTGALALDAVPNRMVVIGGGYIGLELGMVYAKFGTKVTVVEAMPRLLGTMDKDCVGVVERKLKKMGVEVMLSTKAKSWEDKGDRAVLTVELTDGKTATIDTDKILMSIGRRPNSENIGLETIGVKVEKGFIQVDEHLRTNVGGIYAIGDVVGGMMLAHKATKEGEVVAEVIAGHKAAFDVRTIPAVVFTDPEIATTFTKPSVSLTESRGRQDRRAARRAHRRQWRERPDLRGRARDRDGRGRRRSAPHDPPAPDPVGGDDGSGRGRAR